MNNSGFQRRILTVDALFDKVIWFLTAVLFASFYIMNKNAYGSYVLMGITGLILLMMFMKGRGRIQIQFGAFHWFVLSFAIYAAMTALWARSSANAIEKATTIIEILICISVLYWHYAQKDSTEDLLKAVMWGAYFVVLYTLLQYGIGGIMEAVENEERFDVEFDNINSVALVASTAIVINIYFFKKKIKRLSIVFALPAVLLVGASGSRKAMVLLLLGFLLIFMLDTHSRSALIKILKIMLVVAVAWIAVRLVLSLPVFKVAAERLDQMLEGVFGTGESDSSTRKRMAYVEYGWMIFKQYPLFGIGMNNSYYFLRELSGESTYLHNNFIEVLVCGGVVGFVIYYAKYVYLIFGIFKTKLKSHKHSAAVITVMLMLLIMEYGLVSYYSKHTYFYLMLYFLHLQNVKKGMETYADPKIA